MLPGLKIAGTEPSKFRAVAPGRGRTRSPTGSAPPAPGVVLVGLGCPRQEVFAYAMRPLLDMPMLAVGAAFDYHAGLLAQAAGVDAAVTRWSGCWRLGLEPARLWRRYLLLNPAYLARLCAQKVRLWRATPAPGTGDRSTRPV